MTGRSVRRHRARGLTVLATTCTLLAAWAGVPADAAPALTPPPPDQQACARFAALQEALAAVGTVPTTKKTFASIHRATRVFRQVAAKAPDEIADDMQLLAASIGALDRKLASLASDIRPARSTQELEAMLVDIQQVFTGWTASQDVEALGAAQDAVDEWLFATCGFRLSGESSTSGTTTVSCDSAEGTVQAVFAAWQAGERATAAACATDAVVTELFSLPQGVEMTYAGCTGIDSTNADCTYRYEGGALVLTVTQLDDRWQITRITGHPD